MSEADFFRQPLAEMIDPRHPLAVLAGRLPWAQIEAALAPRFARQVREVRAIAQDDLFGPSLQVAGAGFAAAGSAPLSARPGWRSCSRPRSTRPRCPRPSSQPSSSG